ncbi:MAG: hypothetical protein WC373_00815 [Smithella sp.]|jgi:hypothetical protein
MNKKPVEWEDVWEDYIYCTTDLVIKEKVIAGLQQAERSGLICRNVPTEQEIYGIVAQGYCTERNQYKVLDYALCLDIAKSISARLRGEHPDLLKGK